MGREEAIEKSLAYFDDTEMGYLRDLSNLVKIPTESQNPESGPFLAQYLEKVMVNKFGHLGFDCNIYQNPIDGCAPVLLATRIEGAELPTILGYGHGDVILGQEGAWDEELDPWQLTVKGDRIYGRGTADNKGQHLAHLVAFSSVLQTRGRLGFNSKFIMEMGEERGSPGLRQLVAANQEIFSADAFFASDGPRVSVNQANLTLGNRGVINFKLVCNFRDWGHHSGNWGGLLANPGVVLAHAIASIVDAKGRIKIPEWRVGPVPERVRLALEKLYQDHDSSSPEIDSQWGEPELTAMEKVTASNTFEILAFETGDPRKPVNAIPPRAVAYCQLRFVVGTDHTRILENLREHLDHEGFAKVEIANIGGETAIHFEATRTDPDHPWAIWVKESVERTQPTPCGILPNSGGSNVTEVMQYELSMPTVWLPLSHAACSQHAPNEHILGSLMREGLASVTGVYWDLGVPDLQYNG